MEVGTEQAVSFFKWVRAVVLDLLRANLSESRNRGGFEESSDGVVRRRPTSGVGKVAVARFAASLILLHYHRPPSLPWLKPPPPSLARQSFFLLLSRTHPPLTLSTNSSQPKTTKTTSASRPKKRFVGSSSAAAGRARIPLNQIPDEILNDPELNEAIKTLPSNYNFEVCV